MATVERGCGPAAAEPGDASPNRPRLRVQDRHGDSDAGVQDAAGKLHGILPRIRSVLWANAQMLGLWKVRARQRESARSHRAFLRRVLLQRRDAHGHWNDFEIREDARSRREDRD